MGQSLMKLGSEEKKDVDMWLIAQCYEKFFVNTENWNLGDYHHAVCRTIEEINKSIGSTQLRVPKPSTLEHAYQKHHQGKGRALTKEEFQQILQEVISDTGVTNIVGAKDLLFYLYGVPATALILKQRLIPKLIPNEIFIPVVTSATVFLLAKLNKI